MRTGNSRARHVRRLAIFTSALTIAGGLAAVNLAWAGHGNSGLPLSDFEIDTDANLKVDDPSPSIDWASVTEVRTSDLNTGSDDNSYSGGAKEDTPCPGIGTGSIPNNKSDLLTFGTYIEPEPAGNPPGPGYLHLFWSRVAEPSGTTLMDFELNQSSMKCVNGVNPIRTAGDILLEYRLEQGGSTAVLKSRIWSGSAWGAATDLTAASMAVGTSNSTAIPGSESDGLAAPDSSLAEHTFGEATLDLDFIFKSDKCTSFGSAFLKSRSSDSFTSQMKDFIAPQPINLTNCGTVIIRKATDPTQDPAVTEFTFNKNFGTDPSTANSFTLKHGQAVTFNNVLFGTGRTVTEVVPAGWNLTGINCGASTGVAPVTDVAAGTVTFAIDNSADVVDCTYTNAPQKGAIRIVKTRKHAATPNNDAHQGVSFEVTGGGLTQTQTVETDANGVACLGNLELTNTPYVVHELVPAGYVGEDDKQTVVTTESSCANTPNVLTFHNTPLTTIKVEVDSLVAGGTASTVSCTGPAPANTSVATLQTDATDAQQGDGSVTTAGLVPGTYTCTIVVDP